GASPDQDEYLLQHLLRFAPVAEDAKDQPVEETVVPIVQLADGGFVTVDDPIEKRDIRRGLGLRLHVSRRLWSGWRRLFYPHSGGCAPPGRARTAGGHRDR